MTATPLSVHNPMKYSRMHWNRSRIKKINEVTICHCEPEAKQSSHKRQRLITLFYPLNGRLLRGERAQRHKKIFRLAIYTVDFPNALASVSLPSLPQLFSLCVLGVLRV